MKSSPLISQSSKMSVPIDSQSTDRHYISHNVYYVKMDAHSTCSNVRRPPNNNEAKWLTGAARTRIALLYPDTRMPFLTEVLVAPPDAANARGTQLMVRDASVIGVNDADVLVTQALAAGAEALVLIPRFAKLLAG
ncbi:hypothetical protein [Xanthomonas cannabis]|uniref:hypothetical protein n=1 Tax=Xanthomonas cannabis TaxID=1885674 RepID=UPI0016185BC6|nr:hypothetical protein [Xanthomonas cannabis]